MSLPRHRLLEMVLLCSLALLLTQCVPANAQADPPWFIRLDPGGSYHYQDMKWSPDSMQIVYTRIALTTYDPISEDSRTGELFVMDVETRQTRQLTFNDSLDYTPSWSPDSKRIAYVRDDLAQGVITTSLTSLHIVNADGTDDKEIFVCPRGCGWLSWSSVSNQIAFDMVVDKHVPGKIPSEIFLIDSDGSDLRQVTQGNNLARQPRWSPDGRQLVFLRDDLKPIRVLDIQSQVETAFDVGGLRGVDAPGWSPDQSGIIFAAGPPDQSSQLYFLRLSDGVILPLFDATFDTSKHYLFDPDWSPDGIKLVFNDYGPKFYLVDMETLPFPLPGRKQGQP